MMRHVCDACAMQLKGQAPALEGDRLPQGTCELRFFAAKVAPEVLLPLLYAHTVIS